MHIPNEMRDTAAAPVVKSCVKSKALKNKLAHWKAGQLLKEEPSADLLLLVLRGYRWADECSEESLQLPLWDFWSPRGEPLKSNPFRVACSAAGKTVRADLVAITAAGRPESRCAGCSV